MFVRTSKAHWNAIALAYPLYGLEGQRDESMSSPRKKKKTPKDNSDEAPQPSLQAILEDFLATAVPRIAKTFDLELSEEEQEGVSMSSGSDENAGQSMDLLEAEVQERQLRRRVDGGNEHNLPGRGPSSSPSARVCCCYAWQRRVPPPVDSLLAPFFGLQPYAEAVKRQRRQNSLPKKTEKHQRRLDGSDSAAEEANGAMLSDVELLFLRLLHKERERVDRYYNLYLRAQEELAVFRESHGFHDHCDVTSRVQGDACEPANAGVPFTKVQGEMYPWVYTPLPPNTAAAVRTSEEKTPSSTAEASAKKSQGSLPSSSRDVTASTAEHSGSVGTVGVVVPVVQRQRQLYISPSRSDSTSFTAKALQQHQASDQGEAAAKDGGNFICEECLEPGELYRCSHCQGLRHEACGGPHPPSHTDPDTDIPPPLMLCKMCARALQVGSSSSSLRSSTSTDEREELSSLLEDDDSSLSGFIVTTSSEEGSEDYDETSESDEDNSNGSTTSSAPSYSQPQKKKKKSACREGVKTTSNSKWRAGGKPRRDTSEEPKTLMTKKTNHQVKETPKKLHSARLRVLGNGKGSFASPSATRKRSRDDIDAEQREEEALLFSSESEPTQKKSTSSHNVSKKSKRRSR